MYKFTIHKSRLPYRIKKFMYSVENIGNNYKTTQ